MSRRDQIRMTDDEMESFLVEARTLQVASIKPDGTPHHVPMWFARPDDQHAVWTNGKSQKIVKLRPEPRKTVMAEAGKVYEER
jgi:nitroimidazol reductase NimA-like FMN-containing flavoprotein (pyridoxamine 5'-phosphate oxidase superfamily)